MSDNPIEDFLVVMQKAGFTPKNGKIEPDDKWHPAYFGYESGKKASGTYSFKFVDDDFAIGCFFSRKDPDNKHNWHYKRATQERISPAQQRAIRAKLEAYQREKDAEEERRQDKIARLLTLAYRNLPVAAPKSHKYLIQKNILPHGVRIRRGSELIIPLYGPDGRVNTVQRIVSSAGKFLFPGGKKRGSYFPFVKKNEKLSVILLCEGFATGASIREATGLPVAAAMDSGNLVWVLDVLKKKFPSSKFVICADNDAWTFYENKRPKDVNTKHIPVTDPRWNEWRDAGFLWNVGIDKARQAAAKCGGASVVYPVFEGYNQSGRPTDFNDLAKLAGYEVVMCQIMEAVNAIPDNGEAAAGDGCSHALDQHPGSSEYYPPDDTYLTPDYNPAPEPLPVIDVEEPGDFGLSFKCLGHFDGTYYYFSFKERRIIRLSATGHSIQALLQLDDLDNWYNSKFGNGGDISEKKLALYAQNAMIKLCQHRGVFKEEDRVRGSGAWMDEGRVVVNCGRSIFVDGKNIPAKTFKSEYTYLETFPWFNPSKTPPLTDIEAGVLRNVCESLTWDNPVSGTLLAGWCVIAPVCGALQYQRGMEFRPHIWLTGESQSGKSTVVNRIIRTMLGKSGLNVEGKTSEAYIRDILRQDARPIVFDEAEPGASMEAVIDLARLASTGGTVGKFGQGRQSVRFAACFSSINTLIGNVADESRISVLKLLRNRSLNAQIEFDSICDILDKHITPEYADRMIARTIANMDTLLANMSMLQRAARKTMGDARASEQIAAMYAGVSILSSTTPLTEEQATAMIAGIRFNDYTAMDAVPECERTFQFLASYIVKFVTPTMPPCERTIGELVIDAEKRHSEEDKFLRRYGIARVGDVVHIATKASNTRRLFRGTAWLESYAGRLADLPGAEKSNKVTYFSSGLRTTSVTIPVKLFASTIPQENLHLEEIPF